jgi:hypothetical protein
MMRIREGGVRRNRRFEVAFGGREIACLEAGRRAEE